MIISNDNHSQLFLDYLIIVAVSFLEWDTKRHTNEVYGFLYTMI